MIEFLESLVANKLMVTDGMNYLSLALRTPAVLPKPGLSDDFAFAMPPRAASSYLRADLKVLNA